MSTEFNDVRAFHQRFGLLNFSSPGHLTTRLLRERIECLQEELDEFTKACGLVRTIDENLRQTVVETDQRSQDLAGQADALVDLVYFALGTAVMMGLPWDALWADVQRANMTKVRGVGKRGHQVDVIKPRGWTGPQTESILELYGYAPAHDNQEEHYRDNQ